MAVVRPWCTCVAPELSFSVDIARFTVAVLLGHTAGYRHRVRLTGLTGQYVTAAYHPRKCVVRTDETHRGRRRGNCGRVCSGSTVRAGSRTCRAFEFSGNARRARAAARADVPGVASSDINTRST